MTRVAVLIAGAIGLGLVLRAAFFYSGVDPLAHALVLLIALGFVLGLVELVTRANQIASLSRALGSLPKTPSRADIEASPSPLRTLLGARLSGMPAAVGTAVFTPYLVGLLVMIGLLGTFMGLFETLRGAREALTTSGDVLALREGLAAPMKGLSRAFGTSAAGVSASAMLGLAAVFVRRAEGRFTAKVASLMAGSLFPLTVQGRQLAALEALVEDRDALPLRQVAALEALVKNRDVVPKKQLAALEALLENRDALPLRQVAALEALLENRDALPLRQVAALEALVENRDALPLAAKAIENATLRLQLLEEKLAKQQADTSREASLAFRTAAAEVRKDLQSGAIEIQRDLEAGILRAADAVAPLLDRAVVRAAEVAGAEMSAWSRKLDTDSEARRAEESTHRTELARASTEVLDAISDRTQSAMALDEERTRAAAALLSSIDARLSDHLAALGTRLAGPLSEAAKATQAGPEAVARLVEAERDRLAVRESADRARDERLDTLLRGLERMSDVLAMRSATEVANIVDLDARLGRERDATAALLSERLAAHAQGVGESLQATASLVRDAVGLVHAGGTEMTAVAEMFTGAVDRYCGASEKWLDSLSTIESAVEKKGGGGEAVDLLGAYLDQTREVFDHSLAFQRELFTELRALRARTTE